MLRFGVFLFLFLIIFGLFSYHFSRLMQNDNDRYNRIIETFRHSSPIVLILGDSHAVDAIDLKELGEEYSSLAHWGDNLRQMFLKLDFAWHEKGGIRYVVIPLDYHMLSIYRDRNRDFSRDLQYSTNFHLMASLYHTNIVQVAFLRLCKQVPLLKAANWEKYFLILMGILENDTLRSSKNEASTNWSELDRHQKRARSLIRLKEQLAKPIVVEEMKGILNDLILFCDVNDIKLIGVRYPLTNEYLELATTFSLEKIEQVISAKSDSFFSIFDYRRIFCEVPEYFINTDHLSPQGAKVFSKILKKDIGPILNEFHD